MVGEQQTINIGVHELLEQVAGLKSDGYRLVQIHCTNKDGLELTYSFGQDLRLVNLRFPVTIEAEVASISSIFQPAFLYENEIRELFGVNFAHISIDYAGSLYKKAIKTPFNPS